MTAHRSMWLFLVSTAVVVRCSGSKALVRKEQLGPNSTDGSDEVRNPEKSTQVEVPSDAIVLPKLAVTISAILGAASRQLNDLVQRAADALAPGATRDLLRALRLCGSCQTYERFGEFRDGGYVMCMDGLDTGLAGAMSYGINGFDGWGMQVASRFHIPVHEYDCTNLSRPKVCEGCDVQFHPECIRSFSSKAAQNYGTLDEHMKSAGFSQEPDASLLMKMDVEAAEWKVFQDEPSSSLRKFRQIVVEFHWLGDATKHQLYAKAVQRLVEAGFLVTHLHGNNFGGGLQQFGEYSIPNVLEVTYIRGTGCASGLPYKLPQDHANNPNQPELGDAQLPAGRQMGPQM